MNRRPWHPRMPLFWWLEQPVYRRYMLREASSAFIGAYTGMLIFGLYCIGRGPDAWTAWLAAVAAPVGLAFQAVALLFAVYHSVTWFALAPASMPLRIGTRPVPKHWISTAHYVVWIVLTVAVLVMAF